MQPVIKVIDLVQVINKKTILDGVNLEVSQGEVLGIFATRGTGKTTLLHILAGIDRFTSGTVEILGHDSSIKSRTYKQHLGLVTQQRSLFQELKVSENLDFIATLRGGTQEIIEQLVQNLELKELLGEPVSILDSGDYQRVALACALINKPQLLIADELINDIDLYSRRLILKTIKQFLKDNGTLVCAFSNMDYANQMNRVAWLAGGKLNLFEPEEAIAQWQKQFKEFNLQSGEAND